MYIVRASSSSFNNLFPILNDVRVHIRGVAHRSIICFNRRSSSYNISHAGESINQVTLLFNILNMMQTAYWSYDHLIIQLEVCIDILKFLYQAPEQYETQILVDDSCGHDRQRQDESINRASHVVPKHPAYLNVICFTCTI